MGTEIELLVDGEHAEPALDAAESEFHRLEALLSRFRPDSELSRLNAMGSIDAGPDLVRVESSSHWRPARGPAAASIRQSTTRSLRPATTARSSTSIRARRMM
jgi:hypothetical protein